VKAVGMVPAVKVSPVFSRDWHGGSDELVVVKILLEGMYSIRIVCERLLLLWDHLWRGLLH
jgi:hypothetical protein